MNHKQMRKIVIEEKKAMINVVFSLFDEDNNGHLDYEELKYAFKALGFSAKKAEVLKMLEIYDRKDKKFMCFEDFKTIAIDKIMKCDPIEEMKYAFKLMCGDNQKGIGVKELKRMIELTGLDINSDDIESMINEFDTDQDSISCDGFYQLCMGRRDKAHCS